MGIIVAVTVVMVAGGFWWLHRQAGRSDADCAAVRELLAYNKAHVDELNAKTHVPEPGAPGSATDPSDLDYAEWADGIDDRANRVTAEGLAEGSRELAQTVRRLVRATADFNAQKQTFAPGAQPPGAAMLVVAFNEQYEAQVGTLTQMCPP